MSRRTLTLLAAALALAAAAGPARAAAPAPYDPATEAQNYSKINERFQGITSDPGYQQQLRTEGALREAEAAQILAADGPPNGRNFTGNACFQHMDACTGDVRYYDWGSAGHGRVTPILFTARNGSTLSGHIFSTVAGPEKRPGVVITNGSVQAPEELYWYAATTLAKAGFVVMTFDPQGQGYSDTYGETGADMLDGVPSQSGEPFYDGTEDALDFFFSSPAHPYVPRPSCSSATSHAAKQAARVKAGLDSAFNPAWGVLDPSRVGIAGHSLGAAADSYVGQTDPRVRAVVAWDNFSVPATASQQGTLACAKDPASRPAMPPIVHPTLGMSADYYLDPTPYTSSPDPLSKSAGSLAASHAGVDTGEIIIRGGTHFDYSFIPDPAFGATLRGEDMIAWYTTAWMRRYVAGDDSATAQLTTLRWNADKAEAAVDPNADGNMFSFYYASRLDIGLPGGGRFVCEDLRPGKCAGLSAADGGPADYSALGAADTPDAGTPPAGLPPGSPGGLPGSSGNAPAASGPAAAAGASPPCRDTTPPGTTLMHARITRRRVLASGRARDSACGGAGQVVQVGVAVALERGNHCRYLRSGGVLGRLTACRNAIYAPAAGTTAWRFSARARLPRGRYELRVRAVDAAGNAERYDRARRRHPVVR